MRTVLVATSGGHLRELVELRPRLGPLADDVVWVTFDTPQSRAALAGEKVVFARYTAPRDLRSVAVNTRLAAVLLRRGTDAVISTGAALAMSFLPMARALGIPAHYIECAARVDGPSLTGRLAKRVPGVELYTQHAGWADARWRYGGCVLDRFEPADPVRQEGVQRVVVTLGALPYPFERLLRRLVDVLPADVEVLWQTGYTDATRMPIPAVPYLPSDTLDDAMAVTDVVVAHAGVGSLLAALHAGRCPVLVPRRRALGENVDDHQAQIANDATSRELAITSTVDDLTLELLGRAAAMRVRERTPPPFELRAAGPVIGAHRAHRAHPRRHAPAPGCNDGRSDPDGGGTPPGIRRAGRRRRLFAR